MKNTSKMEVNCGDNIKNVVEKALVLSKSGNILVEFEFNSQKIVVDWEKSNLVSYWVSEYNKSLDQYAEALANPDHVMNLNDIATADDARKITDFATKLNLRVNGALNEVHAAALRGESSVVIMHDRELEHSNGSYVGTKLKNVGFTVDDSNDYDYAGNNYRRILVEW